MNNKWVSFKETDTTKCGDPHRASSQEDGECYFFFFFFGISNHPSLVHIVKIHHLYISILGHDERSIKQRIYLKKKKQLLRTYVYLHKWSV